MNEHGKALKGASRRDAAGWVYVRIAGQPYDRGFQHGYLLADDIREALRVVRYLIHQDTGLPFEWFAKNAMAMFHPILESNYSGKLRDRFGTELLDELRGIEAGANAARSSRQPKVTLEELIAWNGYPELICQWFPAVLAGQVKPAIPVDRPLPPQIASRRFHHFHLSCSSFVAVGTSTADGGIVAAHTTWQRFANGDAYNVVLDITPANGHRILMQSVPGYVHSSTDFWQTSAGLVITETSLNVAGFDATGLPEFLRARRAAQFARSIAGWCDLFRFGNNGGYVNTWLLADARRKEIAAYELTLHHEELQPVLRDGVYAACNIPLSLPIRQLDSSGPAGYDNVLMSAGRRVRFDQLLTESRGRLDAQSAARILADHSDMYLGTVTPTSRTICGHFDNDNGSLGSQGNGPYYPFGSLDAKVTTGTLVKQGRFEGRWGRACGLPLNVDRFLEEHPQYEWLRGYMRDRPEQPFVTFPYAD
jgi:hypothetical protein